MTNNKTQAKQSKGPSKKTGKPAPAPRQQKSCPKDGKKESNQAEKAVAKLVKADAKLEAVNKEKIVNSTLLLPLISKGLSRDAFPLEVSPDATFVAMIVLAVCSYCMAFLPKGLGSQADALLGCLWEDTQLAIKGMRSKFQQAPKIWWEIRQAWTPCSSKSYTFNYDALVNNFTYSAASSYYLIGNQFTTMFGPGTGASAFVPYTALIDVANANYDIASDIFAYSGSALKLRANPFENTKNHDPSAFAVQVFSSSNTLGFGACASNTVAPTDYNRYSKVLPRSRFNSSLTLSGFTASTSMSPLSYSIMSASASTEIGHRMFCDFIGAPEEIREFLPVCVRVDINQLILATMNLLQRSFLDGGVGVGSITSFGSYDMAAYLFCVICEWFGPWSQVTYPRGWVNGVSTLFYNMTSGSLIQNMWTTKPVPAALAVNLSHLIPCVDAKLKRVYYPSLDLNAFAFTTFPAATYTVFSANALSGVTPWSSLTTTQWAAFFDTTGAIANVLTTNAGSCPMRTLPHTSKVLSLACHVQMKWYEGGTTINVVATSHAPTDEERELYTLMILPNFANSNNGQFYEYARFFGMRELSVLPNASDPTLYYGFAAKNSNMLSTTAKVYLDEYDRAQEEHSSTFGFVGTVATMVGAVGSAAAYANADSIRRIAQDATYDYMVNRIHRRV